MSSVTYPIESLVLSEAEVSRVLQRKARSYINVLFWSILFIFPLFCILDFIFAPTIWHTFFFIRLILLLIFYAVYDLGERLHWSPNILMHTCFAGISLSMALLCTLAPIEALGTYYLIYSIVFICFNLMVLWKARNSVFQAILAFAFLILLDALLQNQDRSRLYADGSQLFFVIALFSSFIPNLRYASCDNDVRLQLLSEKSLEQLQVKNGEIHHQNRVIDEKNQELLKLSEQKNNFINMAGYGFKNTVSSIMMSVDLLKTGEQGLDGDQKELVELIEQSAEKMQETLGQLLDAIEIEAREITFEKEDFDLNQVVKEIAADLSPTASLKNIILESRFYSGQAPVQLDRRFVTDIYRDILSNGIRTSSTNNTLTLLTGVQFNRFFFEMVDPHSRVEAPQLEAWFHQQSKLSEMEDAPEQEPSSLATARLLTEALGGYVIYTVSAGEGLYIRVEFPLKQAKT